MKKEAQDAISIKGLWSYIILIAVGFMALPFYFISSAGGEDIVFTATGFSSVGGDVTKMMIGNLLFYFWEIAVTVLLIVAFIRKKK